MTEEWRDVKGYEGFYQVSDKGRVRSLDRTVHKRNQPPMRIKGRLLIPELTNRGYERICLSRNDARNRMSIHQLVAQVFLGHTLCGHKKVVDHIDGNRRNNMLGNLQIISARENIVKGKASKRGVSKHVGVSWHKRTGKWIAQIGIGKKRKHLGLFTDELEAAKAYQDALKELKNEMG